MDETLKLILNELQGMKGEITGIKGEIIGMKERLDSIEAGQKELYQLTSSIEDLSRTTAASLRRLENRVEDQNEYIIKNLSKNDQNIYVLQKEIARISLAYDKEPSLK